MLGVVTPYSVGFSGLFLAVLPLHPLGNRAYLQKVATRFPFVALAFYALGLGCAAYSVYGMVFHRPSAMYFVFPALLYWFVFTEPGKANDNMKRHLQASGAPEGNNA